MHISIYLSISVYVVLCIRFIIIGTNNQKSLSICVITCPAIRLINSSNADENTQILNYFCVFANGISPFLAGMVFIFE